MKISNKFHYLIVVALSIIITIKATTTYADETDTTARGPSYESKLLSTYARLIFVQEELKRSGASVVDSTNLQSTKGIFPQTESRMMDILNSQLKSQLPNAIPYINPQNSCEGMGYSEHSPFIESRYLAYQFIDHRHSLHVVLRHVWYDTRTGKCMVKSAHAHNTWG